MATITVDSTHPSATAGWSTANITTLITAFQKILAATRENTSYQLNPDEYQCLWCLTYGASDGVTNNVGTSVSQIVATYT